MGRIVYVDSTAGLGANDLRGFFAGWPDEPPSAARRGMLGGSDYVILALDEEAVVGFVAALADGVLCAFVSSLQVHPAYGGRGIGSELLRRMLERLDDHYVVSLTCDPALRPFYERFGMRPSGGMLLLNRDRHPGPDA